MRLSVAMGAVFFSLLTVPGFSQQVPAPLKQDQIMDLVKAGMDPSALVKLIREHGLDFDLTDDYLQSLRAAQAPGTVIQALRAVKPQPLSRSKLLALVANGVPAAHITDLVRDRGLSFYADEEYLQTLRLAGADDALVSVVRTSSAKAAANLEVVTTANAEVYLDGQLQGHANAQGNLTVKSVLGSHALKVSLAGKQDFQQNVTLAASQTGKVEAHLEDASPAPGVVAGTNPYPGLGAAPVALAARQKSEECMTIVQIWNSRLQQAMYNPNFSQRGGMASQINDVNQERLATYRTKLMPQVRDLQQKMLTELGRASSEHLDYEMVSSAMQLLQVCTDLRSLASQYQLKLLQPK